MLKFKNSPSLFEEDIEKVTHFHNLTEDWALMLHICDNTNNYEDGAKHCLKAIMKRLHHRVPKVVMHALTLLDTCVKNCDRRFLLQVASREFTSEVQKLLPEMCPSGADKLKEMIQRWSLEEFKEDPELCIIPALYYKLKSEGVEFPPAKQEEKKTPALCTNPDGVSSQQEEEDIIKAIEISLKDTGRYQAPNDVSSVSSSKPLPEPMKVRALYDFDAAEDNELTIKAGEIVVVLDQCSPSWWKGSNHRGEGLFPSNFVTEDLDFQPEESKVSTVETKTETVAKILEDEEVKLDEKKIELVLNWLNDVDPTEETSDPEEMLILEKQCHNMTPIIEENLQAIDKKLALLSQVNEKIMSAFDLFHSLSDISAMSQSMKYYTGTLNQHIVQYPHPQVSTLPQGTMLHQSVVTPVLHQFPVPANLPQSMNQIPQPVGANPVSTTQQKPQMPSSSTPQQTVPEVTSSTQTAAAVTAGTASVAAALPVSQDNPVYNLSMVGGYCVPSASIPYPVQSLPNLPQNSYIHDPSSAANVMAFPYAVPPMRPYFPFPYYYVNSNPPQNIPTTSSTELSKAEDQTPVTTTTATNVSAPNASIPVVTSYSNELHNLSLNSSGDSCPANLDQQFGVQKVINEDQPSNDMSKNELGLEKNL